MAMPRDKAKQLSLAIRKLKAEAQHVASLSQEVPAAEKNCSMILGYIEMLEIEICDAVDIIVPLDPD